jgi:predicted amidohydrolase
MKGVDKGKLKWMVHKYYLWKGDYEDWDPAPILAPIVRIRNRVTVISICYEIAFVSRFNKPYQIGKIAKKAKAEILLMPADWAFNFRLPQNVLSSAFNCIPSLKVGLFSCRRELAFASTRKQKKKITEKGWVSVEI